MMAWWTIYACPKCEVMREGAGFCPEGCRAERGGVAERPMVCVKVQVQPTDHGRRIWDEGVKRARR